MIMVPLIQDTNAYLADIVGFKLDAHMRQKGNEPIFISDLYTFTTLKAGKDHFLGIMLRKPEAFRPSDFEKHQRFFPHAGEGREYKGFVVIAPYLEGFIRKRLIEMKIPFIVPGMQLYWPELGMEYRTHSRNKAVYMAATKIDPATQAVLIGALNGTYAQPITPTALGQKLGYTAMTMTRALDEIEAAKLGAVSKAGRQRLLTFPGGAKALWEKAKPVLINPVRATFYYWKRDIQRELKLLAGESALSELSDLVAPRTATYALGRAAWQKFKEKPIPQIPVEDDGTCAVQVWRYDPALFAKQGSVDVFSLYLSLQDNKDERVEMALSEVIEGRLL